MWADPASIAVLVTAILGPTGVWGIKELSSWFRKKRRDQPITSEDVQEASGVVATLTPDSEAQIRELQNKLNAVTGLLGDLASRVDTLENERDEARRLAESSDLRFQIAVAYIARLRDHIVEGKNPPPPDWPVGWEDYRKDRL